MLTNEIDKLGKGAFVQSLTYKKPHKWKETAIIGSIDFEYTKQNGLISVQLSIEGHTSIDYIDPEKGKEFYIKDLRDIIKKRIKEAGIALYASEKHKNKGRKTVYLASFYSTAEFSQINRFWNDVSVRNVTQNIINISFALTSHKIKDKKTDKMRVVTDVRCSIIDIYHFFSDLKTASGKKSLKDVAMEFKKVKKLGGKYRLEGIGGKTGQYWIEHMDKLLAQYPVKFEQYALQDVIITEKLLREYRKKVWLELQVDLLQASTNGAIATNYFRMHEMSPNEKFGNTNTTARRFAMQCAHGAVMVALKRGKFDNIYENDFTGFYSYSLANCELLPRNSDDIITAYSLEEALSGYDGWVKIKFNFPETYKNKRVFPSLPVQEFHPGTKKKSLILFPRTGISYCTVSEVRGALLFGAEIEFIEGYYYSQGTNKGSQFAKKQIVLRAKAHNAHDKVGEGIHKSQPNHFTGKLLQHKGGFDLSNAKIIAGYLHCPLKDVVGAVGGEALFSIKGLEEDIEYNEKTLPPEEAKKRNAYLKRVKATGGKVSSEMRIGASWLPEWWSLILGRSRAALWWVVNTYGENVTHLSTDSFHDTKPLSGDIMTPFGMYKIHQTTDTPKTMVINRTKLYIFNDKPVHHAVHIHDEKKLVAMIENADKLKYAKTGKRTLRSAIIEDEAFGSEYKKEMQFDSRWDNKMELHEAGSYSPWASISDYFAYVEYEKLISPEGVEREDRKREVAYTKIQKAKRVQAREYIKETDNIDVDMALIKEEREEDAIREMKRWCG